MTLVDITGMDGTAPRAPWEGTRVVRRLPHLQGAPTQDSTPTSLDVVEVPPPPGTPDDGERILGEGTRAVRRLPHLQGGPGPGG